MTHSLTPQESEPAAARLDYLDAVRAFALILGIIFHASVSFVPIFLGWAVMDVSTSYWVTAFFLGSHSFRMGLFFLIAGYLSHLTYHAKGGRAFLRSRSVRLVVPFVVGWFILYPLIISAWVMGAMSMRGEVDIAAGLRAGWDSLAALPEGIFTRTHLWFLYYLIIVTVVTLLLRTVFTAWAARSAQMRDRADAGLAWIANSRWPVALLAVPTAMVLWFMTRWGVDTPDRSLIPQLPVTLLYGGFFVFGWILHRQPDRLAALAQLSVVRLATAGVSFFAMLRLAESESDMGHPHFQWLHLAFVVSYAVLMWSLILLLLGVFQRLFRRPNATIRYLADSSYWLYLVHLPIVVWLQIAVAELAWPWPVKWAGLVGATMLIALLSYDLLVRSTFVGQILNGKRRERALFP